MYYHLFYDKLWIDISEQHILCINRMKWSDFMKLAKNILATDRNKKNNHLLHILDRGIDDMEAGRELPLEDAFRKITELRNTHRNAKL